MFSGIRLGRSSRAMVAGGLVALTASVVVGGVSAEPVGADPGNPSGNKSGAKACQKGGFNNVVRQDNSGFTRQGACVAYAAQGGVLQPKPPPTAQQICEGTGGTFETGGNSVAPLGVPLVWSCMIPITPTTSEPDQALVDRCFADGGRSFGYLGHPFTPQGTVRAECYK